MEKGNVTVVTMAFFVELIIGCIFLTAGIKNFLLGAAVFIFGAALFFLFEKLEIAIKESKENS